MVRYGVVRCGKVWFGLVGCGLVWYGKVRSGDGGQIAPHH